jgi:proline iminopeptidase
MVDVNGTNIFYKVEGTGQPLILMHGGLGLDHTTFEPWLNPLAKKFRLVYYDHRGNGRSDRPNLKTLTHENFIKDAEELRKQLGYEKFILLGHSYGSFLGLEYAIKYQENLTHLILIGTAPSYQFLEPCRKRTLSRLREFQLDTPDNIALVERWIVGEIKSPEEFKQFNALYTRLSPPHPERSTDTILDFTTFNYTIKNCLSKYDIRNQLEAITVPTLIVNGRHDWDTPIEQAALVHKGLPNSTFIIFENSEHEPFADETDLFVRTVMTWIEKTRAGTFPL